VGTRGTPATALLVRNKVAFTLHECAVDPAAASYGEGAAAALGVDPGRLFKTLVAEVDGRLTVGVVPVTGSLSRGLLGGGLAHGVRLRRPARPQVEVAPADLLRLTGATAAAIAHHR
jgi:prolyl-tRNA editing enzyme YbaK/EbsC (Cys-tRNA(Pro) deacylase)